MEYKAKADELWKHVSSVVSVVPKTTPKPSLQMLMMTVEGNHIAFKATDMNVELKCIVSTGVDVKSEGETLVDAFRFASVLKIFGEKECHIKKTAKNVVVKCGESVFKLIIADPKVYVDIRPERDMVSKCDMSCNTFLELLDRSGFAYGDGKDARFVLEAVCLKGSGKWFECVTADGKRLAWGRTAYSGTTPDKSVFSALLHPRNIDIFKKMAPNTDTPVILEDYDSLITLKYENYEYSIRPAVGKYPDYANMIKNPPTPLTIKAKREDLIHVLNQMMIISNTINKSVWMEASGGVMKVYTQGIDSGEVDAKVNIEMNKVEDYKTLISAKFMLDILNVVEGDEVILNCVGEEVPIHINGKNCHYLLMPLVSME